jgi:hypothetical protein
MKLSDTAIDLKENLKTNRPIMYLDPCHKFGKVGIDQIKLMIGILANWAVTVIGSGATTNGQIIEGMRSLYNYGLIESKVTIDEYGVSQFDGDPPLYPLAFLTFRESQVLFYEHALIAWKGKDSSDWYQTRMD